MIVDLIEEYSIQSLKFLSGPTFFLHAHMQETMTIATTAYANSLTNRLNASTRGRTCTRAHAHAVSNATYRITCITIIKLLKRPLVYALPLYVIIVTIIAIIIIIIIIIKIKIIIIKTSNQKTVHTSHT